MDGDNLTKDPTGTHSPLPELADPPGDYELSVWILFAYDRYDRDEHGNWPPVITGDYVLACGSEYGRWRLITSPLLGHDDDGDITGEPIITLRDQEKGLRPLTLLRALLAGQLV